MNPSAEYSTEALLAHAGWMRALAMGLVRDSHAADDVAQDAALAALLHPPPAGVELRPWLGQVVRRFAWRQARTERRRADREAQAREPAGPEDAGLTLARLDLQRALLDAVRALEEPVRSTLVQRYFEGRTAAEIAAACGVPASTVRARIARGLELLRAKLDRETGSRAAWMALVAPLLPRPTAPAVTASTLASGALTMTLAKSVLVASAAVVAGLAWWNLAPRSTPSEPVALAAAEVPVESPAPLAADGVRSDVPDVAARSQVLAEAPVPEPEPAAPQGAFADDMRGKFDARVVDERGAPWAGAELIVSKSIARSEQVRARGVSGVDGHVQLELALPKWTRGDRDSPGGAAASFDLVVRRAGCASRHLEVVVRENVVTHLGEIVLVESGTVRGRVVDEHGAAVADARVGALAAAAFEAFDERARDRFVRVGASELDEFLARAVRPDGTFELDDVAPGPVRLWAHAPGRRYALAGPVHVVAGDSAPEAVVVLPLLAQTDRIAGRVIGPDGRGRPAGLIADVRWGSQRKTVNVRSDMEGRFELVIAEPDAVYALTAHDGYDEFMPRRVEGIRPGDVEITIALSHGAPIEVRVVDEEGGVVPGADIHVSNGTVSYSAKAAPRESGAYEMELPDVAFRLEVAAPGFREARSARFEPGSVPSPIVVALRRAPRVRGVVTADGAPVAGARVEAFDFDERGGFTVNGLRCVVSTFESGTVVADDQGRFELSVDSDGPVVVRASAAGWVDAESEPIKLVSDGAGAELELALGRGGAIEGRVLVPAGESAAGRVVGAHRGDGRPISTRAAEDGTYRFGGLMPGDWHVFPLAEEYRPHAGHYSSTSTTEPMPWSCRVEEGRASRFDLALD